MCNNVVIFWMVNNPWLKGKSTLKQSVPWTNMIRGAITGKKGALGRTGFTINWPIGTIPEYTCFAVGNLSRLPLAPSCLPRLSHPLIAFVFISVLPLVVSFLRLSLCFSFCQCVFFHLLDFSVFLKIVPDPCLCLFAWYIVSFCCHLSTSFPLCPPFHPNIWRNHPVPCNSLTLQMPSVCLIKHNIHIYFSHVYTYMYMVVPRTYITLHALHYATLLYINVIYIYIYSLYNILLHLYLIVL